MTTSITAHSAENHPVITYQNVRVTTTELLAQFYGTDVIRIQQNFTRNADRFVEGKHYFKLEGENLRQFKQLGMLSFSEYPALKTTSRLTLWTQRGAARHAKILDTDQAWDVFEALENAYFNAQPITRPAHRPPNRAALDIICLMCLPSVAATLAVGVASRVTGLSSRASGFLVCMTLQWFRSCGRDENPAGSSTGNANPHDLTAHRIGHYYWRQSCRV